MTVFEWLHFNRPTWLLLIPIVWLLASLFSWQRSDKALKTIVAAHLLPFLTDTNHSGSIQKWLGLVSISLFVIGLSGISFSKTETELYSPKQKTVFIVDQSLSLYATDVRPNRLTRQKQILRDILNGDLEGEMALIAYAGDAYVVSPFTQDRKTLTHFLVALDPLIMPLYGSNLADALDLAQQLINPEDAPYTSFIVLTDDITPADEAQLTKVASAKISLEIISLGTAEGATMQLPDGQILRHEGITARAKTPVEQIEKATIAAGGHYYDHQISATQLAQVGHHASTAQQATKSQFSGLTWQERGHWFALPFLFWLLWQFRSGYILMLLLAVGLSGKEATASPLDWFKTNDQRAQQAFDQGDWQSAAELFQEQRWKAASHYAGEAYDKAAQQLQPIANSAADFYNLGNALALQQDLKAAAKAYQEALARQPDLQAAKENLNYVQKQLDEQAQQQQEQQNPQQSDDSSPSDSDTDQEPPSSPQKSNDDVNKKPQKQDNNSENRDNQKDSNASDSTRSEPNEHSQAEQQQALEQWLRQIQDDPGTLLQRKLWYLHQERRNENRFNQEEGRQPW